MWPKCDGAPCLQVLGYDTVRQQGSHNCQVCSLWLFFLFSVVCSSFTSSSVLRQYSLFWLIAVFCSSDAGVSVYITKGRILGVLGICMMICFWFWRHLDCIAVLELGALGRVVQRHVCLWPQCHYLCCVGMQAGVWTSLWISCVT